MGFYDDKILPHLINKACSMGNVMKLRKQLIPRARGIVLEIGMGSGTNLSFYNIHSVDKLWGLEPSIGMRRKAASNLGRSLLQVDWLDLPGEQIPLPDNSVDTVVLTFTLCTIPDWKAALMQMHRVLKADGRLLFLEHGLSPTPAVRRWQHRITPAWKCIAGGCHLNRPVLKLLQEGGFKVQKVETLQLEKTPKVAGFIYMGTATKN